MLHSVFLVYDSLAEFLNLNQLRSQGTLVIPQAIQEAGFSSLGATWSYLASLYSDIGHVKVSIIIRSSVLVYEDAQHTLYMYV